MVIYGPLEAGFTANQACTVNAGVCPAGMDVPTCEAKLDYECGTSNVITGMLPDSCGAHASPYHFHHSMTCGESPHISRRLAPRTRWVRI